MQLRQQQRGGRGIAWVEGYVMGGLSSHWCEKAAAAAAMGRQGGSKGVGSEGVGDRVGE